MHTLYAHVLVTGYVYVVVPGIIQEQVSLVISYVPEKSQTTYTKSAKQFTLAIYVFFNQFVSPGIVKTTNKHTSNSDVRLYTVL